MRPNTKKFALEKVTQPPKDLKNPQKKLVYQEVKRKVQSPGSCAEVADGRLGTVLLFDPTREQAAIYFSDTDTVEHWLYKDLLTVKKWGVKLFMFYHIG